MAEIPDVSNEVQTIQTVTSGVPAGTDLRYLLAGVALCFVAGIALSLIRGCSDATVGIAVGAGASAVGAMAGISNSKGKP